MSPSNIREVREYLSTVECPYLGIELYSLIWVCPAKVKSCGNCCVLAECCFYCIYCFAVGQRPCDANSVIHWYNVSWYMVDGTVLRIDYYTGVWVILENQTKIYFILPDDEIK